MRSGKRVIVLFGLCFLAVFIILAFPVQAMAADTGQIDAVPITFSMPPVVAGEVSGISATLKARGCYIAGISWYDMYGQLMQGSFTYDNATVVLTVNASPGYFFSGSVQVSIGGEYAACENYGSHLVISKTYTPVVWAPNVVKHPGSETVLEGGLVSFVSYGAFTDECAWTVIDTEGKHYSIDALAEKFPDLQFYTTYGKLNMGPIPMSMNGYKVRCTFSGPGGSVSSGYAEIIVETPEQRAAAAETAGLASAPPATLHAHSFSTELSQDAGYHWYACSCGEASQREAHKFTWVQKREATLDAPGLVQGECSVCAYVLNCRTQLDPEAAGKLKAEAIATPAPTQAPSPSPSSKVDFKDNISGLFDFLKPHKQEYTPE